MAQSTDRLRRYLEADLGECCDEDVENRLADLRALDAELPPDRLEADTDVLAALASETRYRIVRLLVAAEGELCVCELDPLFDVSESAISHALSTLADAGLVARRKDGKWRYYRATPRATALLAVLDGTGGRP